MTRIIRVKKQDNFSTIDNRPVRDRRLSWQAKGLFVYILTLPDDWRAYPEELRKHARTGIAGTRSALKELRKYGYLTLHRVLTQSGRVDHWEYIFHEEPVVPRSINDYSLKSPDSENRLLEKNENSPELEIPQVDFPHVENRILLNTYSNEILTSSNAGNKNALTSSLPEKTKTATTTEIKSEEQRTHEKLLRFFEERWCKYPQAGLHDNARRICERVNPTDEEMRAIINSTSRFDYVLDRLNGLEVARKKPKEESYQERKKKYTSYAVAKQ